MMIVYVATFVGVFGIGVHAGYLLGVAGCLLKK